MNNMEVPKSANEAYKVVPAGPINDAKPLENKENIVGQAATASKSVRFKVPANIDDEEDWQHEKVINELKKKIEDLENDKLILGLQLTKSHQDEIFKENEILKLQLKSMDAMVEENYEMKEELVRLREMTYEERMKDMAEENKGLKKRTGELLIELTDVKAELFELKKSTSHIPKEGKLQPKFNPVFGMPARPQTASTRKN